ncbi:hypothetical protein KCP70_06460 [Salmonella enterica subsp. enterica]|nr:hypothetical protein KCP70_06460 [Salmonella enterica subsp. enterica]
MIVGGFTDTYRLLFSGNCTAASFASSWGYGRKSVSERTGVDANTLSMRISLGQVLTAGAGRVKRQSASKGCRLPFRHYH